MRSFSLALVGSVSVFAAASLAWAEESLPEKWARQFAAEDDPKLELPAYLKPLEIAERQLFAGQNRRALYTLFTIKDADTNRYAVLKATALSNLGRDGEAIALLHDKADQAVQTALTEIYFKQHRLPAAGESIERMLKTNPDSIVGRFLQAKFYEVSGDVPKAIAAYDWFLAAPQSFVKKWDDNANQFESAADLTTIARAVDRWAYLTGSYKDTPGLHDTVLHMFIRAYDVVDRRYWPARVAAAAFYRAHDNGKEARAALQASLAFNPRDFEALRLLGRISLDGYDFGGAERAIEVMRSVDEHSAVADLLDARNLLLQRRPDLALAPLERVLKAQPRNIEALGLKTAVAALQLRQNDVADGIRQVESIDPDNAEVYFEIGGQLGALRQYPRAAEMYKTAIARAPYYSDARNQLGLLYTQSGDEDEARAVLEAARVFDPFNVGATNYLKLLDGMTRMAQVETDHFIILYDAQLDPMIPAYFAPWLEKIHAGVCTEYATEPPVKTKIEVFPTHAEFSVRTTGAPWIGTVGASTGSVIALVTPRKGSQTWGPYNWAQVLRHEYTHTVTLAATENRIPHWMTEGLAVVEERAPMQWSWVPMLYQAVTKDELFTMEGLTWGFVRPKRPQDRTLAYAESAWVCTYIEEKYGHPAILKMLALYRQGKLQDEVFPAVLGVSITQFQESFFAWCAQQVAGWGYDEKSTSKYDALAKEGEALIKAKRYPDALKIWQDIAALRPMDPLPKQRLAGLYLTKEINQPDKGLEYLVTLHRAEVKDNRYAKRLSRLFRDNGDTAKAIEFATEALHIDAYDLDTHKLLLELYGKAGDTKALESETKLTAVLEQWITDEKKRNEGPTDTSE